ncbi:hypothetical protein CHLRE_09g387578v5 [Chlamydomonas reinhardtii]|uniref:Zinc-finger domain-containing protein n=1 Tax=Chlamydomonas reinhardtii TaxID=3055 RepID=A0A2K3DDV1_CHLRE|nr:uncharacterized protein CHLRE_09g387578v5 [Chlamydomonas reinhardtii]PNW78712.1 hypothetical protein CHLRE_09g387578v5 [Chlamydomonas reinhardtii]
MDLDKERRERMAKNQAMLAELGVKQAMVAAKRAAAEEKSAAVGPKAAKPAATRKPRAPAKPKVVLPARRSGRLAGADAPTMAELDDDGKPIGQAEEEGANQGSGDESEEDDGLFEMVDNMDLRARAGRGPLTAAGVEELEEPAGGSRGGAAQRRGKKLNKRGICCHFCRQKKLCGEEDCPHCVHNNNKAECIGKSMCRRCMSSNGIFCRACLDCRYGLELEEVRADPNWICAHCYEEEHGPWEKHGWFCNSSFCVSKKGMKPTGIAIYDARRLGYKSVAHWLQALAKALTPAEVAAVKGAGRQGREVGEEAEAGRVEAQAVPGADTAAGSATAPSAEEMGEKCSRKRKAAAEPTVETGAEEGAEDGAEEGAGDAHTQPEPSSSPRGAQLEGGVEAGVELEAEEEEAEGGAGMGSGGQQAAEADGLDVPLLKRRRGGRKAEAAEEKVKQLNAAAEEAVATGKADEPLASRRRTARTTRVRP